MGNKLSLSFTLSTPLESNRSTLPSVQQSPAWMKGSDKTDQDFKVGILNEDYRNNTDLEQQSGSNPKSRDKIGWIIFLFFHYK